MQITNIHDLSKSYNTGWYVNASCATYAQPIVVTDVGNTVEYIKTVRNEKSSRPKPVGTEIWFNPTAMQSQYTEYVRGTRCQFNGVPGFNYCPATGLPTWYPWITRPTNVWTNWPMIEPDQSEDWALKMRDRIRSQHVSLGQSLVEYRQTAKMFGEFGAAVRDGWRIMHGKLSKRDRRRIHPCSIASAYLMNSYGIQPLASDLFDSYEALRLKMELPRISRHHVRTDNEARTEIIQKSSEMRGVVKVQKNYIVYAEFDPEASIFALGNPLELAWELIPYSFVVDWAVPIGKYLASLDALKSVRRWAGTVTTKRWSDITYVSVYTDNDGYDVVAQVPGREVRISHQRDVLIDIPLPRVPHWKPSTSYKAVLNGLALLASVNQMCKKRSDLRYRPLK